MFSSFILHSVCPAQLIPCPADLLGDLYVYDSVAMAWTDLSAAASGTPPAARAHHGFLSVGGNLYVHGGCGHVNIDGNCDGEGCSWENTCKCRTFMIITSPVTLRKWQGTEKEKIPELK